MEVSISSGNGLPTTYGEDTVEIGDGESIEMDYTVMFNYDGPSFAPEYPVTIATDSEGPGVGESTDEDKIFNDPSNDPSRPVLTAGNTVTIDEPGQYTFSASVSVPGLSNARETVKFDVVETESSDESSGSDSGGSEPVTEWAAEQPGPGYEKVPGEVRFEDGTLTWAPSNPGGLDFTGDIRTEPMDENARTVEGASKPSYEPSCENCVWEEGRTDYGLTQWNAVQQQKEWGKKQYKWEK